MVEDNRKTFETLVQWIRSSSEGHVHVALEIRGSGPTRGVFAHKAIKKGEPLIILPPSFVLCGEKVPASYSSNIVASPWLRTIGAFYKAKKETQAFKPYLDSLPTGFDTLMEWSSREIGCYLAGTTLGAMAMSDREEKALESGFMSAVRPYLDDLGVIGTNNIKSEETDIEDFRYACMCLSTRGFHLRLEGSQDGAFHGPFLLPVIDLLNHDPVNKCTKLQRDSNTMAFFMIAERDINLGEEIFHSYGDNLTSSELLQTFGFVPKRSSDLFCTDRGIIPDHSISPANLSKAEVVEACKAVVTSTFVDKLRQGMELNGMSEDEVWYLDMDEQQMRDLSAIPDDLVIDFAEPLSDELVTLCCLLLFPSDAYAEYFNGDTNGSLLNRSMLDDYFLGKIVCQTLLKALCKKFARYKCISIYGIDDAICTNDRKLLCYIQQTSLDVPRAVYGLTIRLEEKACLQALRAEILGIIEMLDESTECFGLSR